LDFYEILQDLSADERFKGASIGLGSEPFEPEGEPGRLVPVIRIGDATPEQADALNEYARSRGLVLIAENVRGRFILHEQLR
jgi:hypothetical protein